MLDAGRKGLTLLRLLKPSIIHRAGCIGLLLASLVSGRTAELGPLWHDFPLTLDPGDRTEAFGPLFYNQQTESQRTWAVPPLFSSTRDAELDYQEYDFLYPLLTYDRFGEQYRWQFFQLLSFAGGPTQTETERDRFTIFPIYFQQRSSDPDQNYTALVPVYGTLKNRFSRDEVEFVLLPGYIKTRKRDVVTWNYLFPFFHWREGNELQGWQFWPVIGHETKGVTYATNNWGDVNTIGGHNRWFGAWPIFHWQDNGVGTTNASTARAVLPAFYTARAPQRDSTTVLWPFFTWIDDREKDYREWQGPWPFVAFAGGEGKQMTRVLPFYAHAKGSGLENLSYGWFIYRENRLRSEPLERRRVRVLFFLYSDILERNTETGAERKRTDLWPLFTRRQELNGNTRLQVIAPLEPVLANNKSIERNYSHLWSLWRQENNPREKASSQSLLWNLYRHESRAETKKTSLLFGLFRYVKSPEGKQVRLFYIPLGGHGGSPAPGSAARDENPAH
jgi:hypothetical protein